MVLNGKSIYFQLVEESNAEFIISLRTNDKLNQYLSKTTADIDAQKKWICEYKKREEQKVEYYFVISRIDTKEPIGTVRLYDFRINQNSFCWGSWLLGPNKTRTAAIESALLVYNFAFNSLGFENCHFDVRKDNTAVIKFHRKFGASCVGESELDCYFEYTKENYQKFSRKYNKYIG